MFNLKDLMGRQQNDARHIDYLKGLVNDAERMTQMTAHPGWEIYRTYLEQSLDLFEDSQFSTEKLLGFRLRIFGIVYKIIIMQVVKNCYRKFLKLPDEIIKSGNMAFAELKTLMAETKKEENKQ